MCGEYQIEVYNKRVHYKITVRRNITILRGDSGTGKTTLINMIDAYDAGDTSSVTVKCTDDIPCGVLDRRSWKYQLKEEKPHIYFADESCSFIYTEEFAKSLGSCGHYFVFSTRHEAKLAMLPYSVNEIYNLKVTGKYPVQKRMITVNEVEPLVYNDVVEKPITVCQIMTEDTKSGYEFFTLVSGGNCITAGGKSQVPEMLCRLQKPTLVVVDGAAFGNEFEKVLRLYSVLPCFCVFYFPESFEWFLLHSRMFAHYKMLHRKLSNPSKYIDCAKYISWERYFTDLLKEYSGKLGFSYTKGNRLNSQFYSLDNQIYLKNKLLPSVKFKF